MEDSALTDDDACHASQSDPQPLQALAESHNVSIDGNYARLPIFQTHSITTANIEHVCPECGATQRTCCHVCRVCAVCASNIICADTEPVPSLLTLNTEELESRAETSDDENDPSDDTSP